MFVGAEGDGVAFGAAGDPAQALVGEGIPDVGLSIDTDSGERCTVQTFVDLSIAIVVDAIADLGRRGGSITVDPLTRLATLCASAAGIGARAGDAVVDLAVAIVI